MFLTQTQLLQALEGLDDARLTFSCPESRRDRDGNDKTNNQVAYGPHGDAFMQIDPDTGETRCGACAGDLDATAQTKKRVLRRDKRGIDREHFVSG